jgi:RND family efflux transporter MFP subunit
VRVEVVRPERRTVQRTVGEPGQIEAFETTPVHAKIAGYVQQISVNIGDHVKKGQTLAELWVPETEAELKQKHAAAAFAEAKTLQAEAAVKLAHASVESATAKLAEARAGIERAEADVARWQSETERVVQLVSDRAVTRSLLDETRSKLRSAESTRDESRAQVRSAEAALVQSQAALDQARADVVAAQSNVKVAQEDAHRLEALLTYTKIVAPFDGIITRRNVDTGHLMRSGTDVPELFVVARSDLVTVTIHIPEMYSTEVEPGKRALIKVQAMRGRTVEGKVTRTSWALDPKTRTIRTEIDIPNPGDTLRPGLYVYATVILEEHKDVLTVPTAAIVKRDDKPFCVVAAQGKAHWAPIVTGLDDGTLTEIVSGVKETDEVVKAGSGSLQEGQAIEAAKAGG